MASVLIADVILTNSTNINIQSDFTVNNNVTITTTFNSQNTTMYLPSATNIFLGTPAVNLSTSIYTSGVPAGSIAMWNNMLSTDMPYGWAVCNGLNGTPNLIGRFVICAGTKYLQGTKGGDITTTLTIDSLPSHTHGSFNTDNFGHSHNVSGTNTGSSTSFSGARGAGGNGSAINIPINTNDTNHSHPAHNMNYYGNTSAFNILPPYYSLIYIMKLS